MVGMTLRPDQIASFQETLWGYYAQHARDELPWRRPDANGQFDPYIILVSELMLQQTQVSRVIPKFNSFITAFPTIKSLADAKLSNVLRLWQGLGYNRRAKYLWLSAQVIHQLGQFPDSLSELIKLPGVGKNTAGAILAYAYNQPVIFIETNIRTVMLHHFFSDAENVADSLVAECVEQTLDRENPREYYWALMDYGSYLKSALGNASKRSKHYVKQSAFVGSKRQIRGAVIRELTNGSRRFDELLDLIADERLDIVLAELVSEGLIQNSKGRYHL